MFQDPYTSLNPSLTIEQILAEPLHGARRGPADGQDARARAARPGRTCPRTPRSRLPREFSGGQRQRIAIARALALDPKLIVCDEPVSALDLSTQARVLDLFIEIQERTGVAYLFVSHDLAVVRHISHRVAVMYRGEIVETRRRRPGHLARPEHPYTQRLFLAAPVPDPDHQERAPRRAASSCSTQQAAVSDDPDARRHRRRRPHPPRPDDPSEHLRPAARAAHASRRRSRSSRAPTSGPPSPLPKIGLRAMTLSDGPAGVRGPRWDEREPSLNLPSGSALGASWDADLAYRYGAAAASEARRKDVDVVLGPTINLHRSPLGGRHFECFSEDPELTAGLAAAYVAGLQDNGVAATPKHYVANDSETDRFTVDVRPGERALRELYLAPFERAVEAGAWALMSAYNAVDGVTMTENDLLEDPLNSEWGFDGVVVSDWTAVRSLDSVPAAQDLAMPGPAPAWADLVEAVRDGRLNEADLDRKVLRLLLLAERVGALGDGDAATPSRDRRGRARPRGRRRGLRAAAQRRHPAARQRHRVERRRHRAQRPRSPHPGRRQRHRPPGARRLAARCHPRRAARHASVTYELGAVVQDGVAATAARAASPTRAPDEPGLHGDVRGRRGRRALHRGPPIDARWCGSAATRPSATADRIVLHTTYTPEESGSVLLGFAGANHGRLFVDGELVVDDKPVIKGTDLGAAFLNPPSLTAADRRHRGRGRSTSAPSSLLGGVDSPLAGVLQRDGRHRPGRLRPRRPDRRAPPTLPRTRMSRSSSSAPTPRSSPRATTATTSTCPVARTTSCAPSSPPTRARS